MVNFFSFFFFFFYPGRRLFFGVNEISVKVPSVFKLLIKEVRLSHLRIRTPSRNSNRSTHRDISRFIFVLQIVCENFLSENVLHVL